MLPDRRLVVMNRAIILFLCCQAIEESLIPIFQCKPIAKAWTVGMEGSCLDLPVLWWSGVSEKSSLGPGDSMWLSVIKLTDKYISLDSISAPT